MRVRECARAHAHTHARARARTHAHTHIVLQFVDANPGKMGCVRAKRDSVIPFYPNASHIARSTGIEKNVLNIYYRPL